uniref:Uncharacterized protein n=1 Tax=Vespula pensylvanica TaxID=30213 RepID=A0A834NWG4_VESPE|nr:hypothetical protein H0235_010112 [Vespula pensylvanica]
MEARRERKKERKKERGQERREKRKRRVRRRVSTEGEDGKANNRASKYRKGWIGTYLATFQGHTVRSNGMSITPLAGHPVNSLWLLYYMSLVLSIVGSET